MKYFISFLALIFSCKANCQITFTDSFNCPNVTISGAVTGGLIPISSGITADDNWSVVIPIGFTYNFYGIPYTQCIIGSNGCLGFDIANATAYNTWPIGNTLLASTAAAPDVVNCICGPWCDVYIPAGGTIMYSTVGTAPNRKFEVTWCGTAMYSCTTQWLTTQIIIYETSGLAEVHIGHHTFCTSWNGGYAIVGVKNAPGTVATTAPGRDYPANWLATDEAWRFTPVVGPTYTVTPIPYAPIPYAASSIYWYDSTTGAYLGSGASVTVSPTVTTTYEACALGCLDTTRAYITMSSIYSLSGGCAKAINNSPCFGDTLSFDMLGDSTGATYYWWGPGGFTSTSQKPYIYPSVLSDEGLYRVIKTIGLLSDTDSTYVIIHPLPPLILSSNSPLCQGQVDTLALGVTPDSAGEVFHWTGPNGFSAAVQFPTVPGYTGVDTGLYKVVATTMYGCKDSAYINTGLIPQPAPPVITDPSPYCQGSTFIPFTVSATGTVLWWPSATGGTSTTTPSVVSTALPGIYYVWASQIIGSCQSLRGTDSVKVITTPPPPTVTGPTQYCQYIGPFVPLTVITTLTGRALWYTSASGGAASTTEPIVNIGVAGTYNYWISQIDSGCEGPRTAVSIIVHPKPAPPNCTSQLYCQFQPPVPLIAVPSEAGDFLTWFGPGILTTGTLLTPTPQTDTAKLDSYFVNETSIYGCVSNEALDTVRVLPKPQVPTVTDTSYCQTFPSVPLNDEVDSAGPGGNAHLNWYYLGYPVDSTPVPPTTTVGTMTWYVSQTINGCQGDSTAIKVTTIYLPQFAITPSSPWVCQLDSITLAFNGPLLQNSAFLWTIPVGDTLGTGSKVMDSMITVRFDSASQHGEVYLKASDDNGKCFTIDTISIKVVPQPVAASYTKADVCLGDTVSLAIQNKSDDATQFAWYVDYFTLLGNSNALNIISANSNSGGPFTISWVDSGRHVIQLNSFSEEGCASAPSYDTVYVHIPPDASFKIQTIPNTLCIEDSVLFIANAENAPTSYNYSYVWSPAHSFSNINQPSAWGKVEQNQSIITLTVTDPFGCSATTSYELDPGSCCTVAFPNAFTPNGDGHNDFFRPLYTGYHNFHVFRIQNRWGQTVFESTNSDLKWDGTLNGVPQDMGVYFYYIKYDCGGQTIEESGDVTLIR